MWLGLYDIFSDQPSGSLNEQKYKLIKNSKWNIPFETDQLIFYLFLYFLFGLKHSAYSDFLQDIWAIFSVALLNQQYFQLYFFPLGLIKHICFSRHYSQICKCQHINSNFMFQKKSRLWDHRIFSRKKAHVWEGAWGLCWEVSFLHSHSRNRCKFQWSFLHCYINKHLINSASILKQCFSWVRWLMPITQHLRGWGRKIATSSRQARVA